MTTTTLEMAGIHRHSRQGPASRITHNVYYVKSTLARRGSVPKEKRAVRDLLLRRVPGAASRITVPRVSAWRFTAPR